MNQICKNTAESGFCLTMTCARDQVASARRLVAESCGSGAVRMGRVRCRPVEASLATLEVDVFAEQLKDSWLAWVVMGLCRERGIFDVGLRRQAVKKSAFLRES